MTSPAVTEKRILNALHSINATYRATLIPTTGGATGHQTRRAFPPMPVSANVLDARAMACSVMAGWAKVVIDDRDITGCGLRGTDVAGMVGFLTTHAAWLAEHEAGDVAAEELEKSAHDLAVIAAPTVVDWTSLGKCPLIVERGGEQVTCGGQVRAYPCGDAFCATCGTPGDLAWWEYTMFPEASRLVTAKQLIREIHQQRGRRVSVSTISTWLNRGLITSAGIDQEGRRLYDKGEVAAALTRTECG